MQMKKNKELEQAIHELMLENKLKQSIMNSFSQELSGYRGCNQYFIYCEIINTNPKLSYVFNADDEVVIGRSIERCQICIQDLAVSRMHCKVLFWQNAVYIQNISERNTITVRQGKKQYVVNASETMQIFHNDIINIGCTQLQISLLQGTSTVMN